MNKIVTILFAALALSACCSEPQGTAIVAHRGFWKCEAAGMSENSIASLKAAQDNGFWGSECDVHLTADSVAIVNHNHDINGAIIREHNYAELKDSLLPNGEHRPTFDEYLDQAEKCKTTRLIIEIKPQNSDEIDDLLVHTILDAVKAHGLYSPDRVGFISFSLYSCKLIAQLAPEFLNQYLNGELSPKQLDSLGINGLDYHKKVITDNPEWIEQAHDLGMSTNVWTVNKREQMEQMAALKVDAITTNEPLLAREVLGESEKVNR